MSRETNDSSSKALARLEWIHARRLRSMEQMKVTCKEGEESEASERMFSRAQVKEMHRHQKAILEHPVISDGEKEQARDMLKILEPKLAQLEQDCAELPWVPSLEKVLSKMPSNFHEDKSCQFIISDAAGQPNVKLGVGRRSPGVDPSSLPATAAGWSNIKPGVGRRPQA